MSPTCQALGLPGQMEAQGRLAILTVTVTNRLRPTAPKVNTKPAKKLEMGNEQIASKPAGKTRKPTRGTAIKLVSKAEGVKR